jgi:glycosyltransferase involved in cell wall biosynthesis
MIAKFFTGVKQVSSVRFGSNHYLLKPIKFKKCIEYFFYKIIYKRSWKIIANSYAGKNTLINDMKISSSKIVVIQNGFNFNKNVSKNILSKQKTDKSNIIGFVGRLNLIKNPFHAIYVTSILSKSYKIKLLIVGPEDGVLISDLTKYANKNNVDVEFTGHVEMINEYYQLMNVLILPSVQTEGCSNVIIEALSNGVPVVAYNVGDNKLLLDKKRGLVVEKNSSYSFAKAVEYFINNKDDLKNKRIQYIIDNFDVNNMVNKTISVLNS